MDNEFDLTEDDSKEIITRKDKKINSLSEKLEITEKERADLALKAETEAQAKETAEKERDFFKGFNSMSSKYQGATDHQEKIWDKVKSGYDIEDATISVLAKEGKYNPPSHEERFTAAGGSASTGITDQVEKAPKDMDQSERLAILKDMESKGEFRL